MLTLEWLWFIALAVASFGMGRLSAQADAHLAVKSFREGDKKPNAGDNAWGITAHATMVVALYLSWPALGQPVLDQLMTILPPGADMLSDITVLAIMGILGLIVVALPVVVWVIPDLAREFRQHQRQY